MSVKIKQVGSNQTLLEHSDGIQVFYSYETPVALVAFGDRIRTFKTEQFHSVTTSKHINKFLRSRNVEPERCKTIPQEVLENWEQHEFLSDEEKKLNVF